MNATHPFQRDLLSSVPLNDAAREDLRARMTEPTRFYHTLHHLDVLWGRHLRYGAEAGLEGSAFDVLIAAAIAFHDAVFTAGARDNEERSACYWLEVSGTATSLGPDDRFWVADTIRATADHLAAAPMNDLTSAAGYARQWVLDLDLTPLGEEPDVFDRNMDLLRAEAAHKPTDTIGGDLTPALRHFASAKPLYRCPPVASAFEEAAQRNFSRHLA